jgi:hypothetical protein
MVAASYAPLANIDIWENKKKFGIPKQKKIIIILPRIERATFLFNFIERAKSSLLKKKSNQKVAKYK